MGECLDDAAAGMFQRAPSPVCAVLVPPHLGGAHGFPSMWLSRRGFYDHRGATFTLYSLHLKTSPWFPGAGCRIAM